MSELLLRGFNVACPLADIGDDIYSVSDSDGNLVRIQVKSANCRTRKDGFYARVQIPLRQIHQTKETKLVFIIALRERENWHYVVISRAKLEEEMMRHEIGKKNRDDIALSFRYLASTGQLLCSGYNFTKYLGWDAEFPA